MFTIITALIAIVLIAGILATLGAMRAARSGYYYRDGEPKFAGRSDCTPAIRISQSDLYYSNGARKF